MQNPICISTGSLYHITNDRNEMISKLREFSPDGIELSFAYPQYLSNFLIKNENLDYLQSLNFNSIHAPWKDITYDNSHECESILNVIEKLYKKIRARNVVFHRGEIENVNIFDGYDFVASIENYDWKKPYYNTPEKIEMILNENRNLKFTFDFAHALTVSSKDIPVYINKFNDRLVEIHVAMQNKKLKDHCFLHKYDSQKMKTLLSNIKNTTVPVVLEGVASSQNEIGLIKKEMKYLKSI